MAVKNLVSGVLAQSITTSTANVLVNIAENIDASGVQSFFPTPPFYITIMPKTPTVGVANRLDSEILQVTAVGNDQSGNASLTCVRGQRDTTAKAFSAGDIVTVGIYAEEAVLLGSEGSTTSTTAYRKKLVDKDGNTIIPIMGYMGTVYTATLSSATAGGRADYEFTPDTPIENNKVYAVKFPDPTVNNATIILGDGIESGSILVPPVAATDSPNYELLTTDMINDTEPLLLMYIGVQWVCLNQKKKVATADLENNAVKANNIDFTTFNSNGLPTADGSASRQNVGTVYYKKILPKIFLLWGNIKPIYDDNSIKLPFSSAMSDYSQVFTLYGAGMNSTKGFIAPGASNIGFSKQTTGNTYALWGIAALNG